MSYRVAPPFYRNLSAPVPPPEPLVEPLVEPVVEPVVEVHQPANVQEALEALGQIVVGASVELPTPAEAEATPESDLLSTEPIESGNVIPDAEVSVETATTKKSRVKKA